MTREEYIAEQRKLIEGQRLAELQKNKDLTQGQIDSINAQFDRQLNEIDRSYNEAVRANNIQKNVDKMVIAEDMANMGLSDSGLNRSQITAIQLGHMNREGRLTDDRSRKFGDVDFARNQGISGLKQQQLAKDAEVNQYFENMAQTTGTNLYNAEQNRLNKIELEKIKAQNAIDKEMIKQSAKYVGYGSDGKPRTEYIINRKDGVLSRNYYGTLAQNGVKTMRDAKTGDWIFVDTNNKNITSRFKAGVNPYTNTTNADLLVNGIYDPKRACRNGYQPKYKDGKKLWIHIENAANVAGNPQSVWTDGENYFLWDGGINEYHTLSPDEKKAFKIK